MALRLPHLLDTKNYPFAWFRYQVEAGAPIQEGVMTSAAMAVTAAAGGGMRVDIAAGSALVKGDTGSPVTGLSHGLYLVANDASVANAVTLTGSHATLPRLDQIVLRVRDSTDLASGADDALFEVLTGTATSGATLDNRNGAAALTNDRLRLADVLVPAASSAVTAGNVRDRRTRSRGNLVRAANGSDLTTTSSTTVATLSGEFSGASQRIVATGPMGVSTVVNDGRVRGIVQRNGTEVASMTLSPVSQGQPASLAIEDVIAGTTGFATFTLLVAPYTAGNTAAAYGNSLTGFNRLVIEEVVGR